MQQRSGRKFNLCGRQSKFDGTSAIVTAPLSRCRRAAPRLLPASPACPAMGRGTQQHAPLCMTLCCAACATVDNGVPASQHGGQRAAAGRTAPLVNTRWYRREPITGPEGDAAEGAVVDAGVAVRGVMVKGKIKHALQRRYFFPASESLLLLSSAKQWCHFPYAALHLQQCCCTSVCLSAVSPSSASLRRPNGSSRPATARLGPNGSPRA